MADPVDPAPALKRGAIPTPRHKLMSATPFKTTAHLGIAARPAEYANIPTHGLSMWGNDQYGDCVTAEEAFAKLAANPNAYVNETDVIAWARSHGWLNGAELTPVMDAMARKGLPSGNTTYQDGPYFGVDWTNRDLLCDAIYLGPVKIGIAAGQFDNAAGVGQHNGWFMHGFVQDDNEDHCVTLTGYGTLAFLFGKLGVPVPAAATPTDFGYLLFTWSTIGVITEGSMKAVTGEAWVRNPTTAGFGPTPVPPAPPVPPVPPVPPTPVQQVVNIPDQTAHALGFIPVTVHGGTFPVVNAAQGIQGPMLGFNFSDLWKIAQHSLAIWAAIKSDQALKDAVNAFLADFGIAPILTDRMEQAGIGAFAGVNYFTIAADVFAIVMAVRTYGPLSAQTAAAVAKLLADLGWSV